MNLKENIYYNTPFIPDTFYHIYNRGNNKEKIFFYDSNYEHFLKLFDKYLSKFVDIFSYCLLPNHFHFVIRVKSNITINENIQIEDVDRIICEQFRIMFMSYSKAINKQENREGSLFQKNFKKN